MTLLFIVGEGQTEEAFVKSVLAPVLRLSNIIAKPLLIETSRGHRGGGLSLDRTRRAVRNVLLEHKDAYVSTMFDLYALDKSFAGVNESVGMAPPNRASHIERLLHADIVARVGCRPERFIAHVQPHEFESLLFSDIGKLCDAEPEWDKHRAALAKVRAEVTNPECINDSPQTAPSKRLEILRPRYRKTTHGPASAIRITLDKIREQCPHFRQWFERLLQIGAQPLAVRIPESIS
ncbi:hypothetical protein ASG35_06665 [Burkholderia sp. Leaf177]|uniref:DUF4276 family protein n=1 Tax=Burkholderia sp. Leaf177 TaxID=1736287 RepID=UPI0006FBE239|nr:DUF4276 family protein [Burkholderia sp. Leaf177]KQR79571.1 hypothetical protein ASG35_06665 [Burkholderia sp. Leaf177]